MYKCKECGSEFDIKPDYCDCGNDEFEEIVNIVNEENIPANEPLTAKISTEKIPQEIKITQKSEQKKSFSEQYPKFENFKKSLDPISLIIFSLCIILSLYVVFFAWNPKETIVNTETQPQKTEQNIPSIDKFWNNTPPKAVEEKPAQKVETVQPKPIVSLQKQVQQKQIQKPVKKIQTVQKPKATTVKLVKNPQISTVEQANNQEKAKQEAELKAKQEAVHKAQQQAILKQELNNYKAGLRNTLGRKIDFTRVVGDGECTVSFKLNDSGKLINRSFSKQSSNITLNDAVYQAVMSTPSYNPPPTGYNGEMLSLNIRFYNGNFEISLR